MGGGRGQGVEREGVMRWKKILSGFVLRTRVGKRLFKILPENGRRSSKYYRGKLNCPATGEFFVIPVVSKN